MSFRKLFCIFFILIYAEHACAQLDSICYRITTQAAFSNQGYLPLWIVSNRYGVLDDETDALLRAGFEAPYTKGKKFDVSYGLDLVGKKNLGNSRIQQGFVKVKYGIFEVRGGRIEETTGLQNDELSSGSLAQSRNAMPLPKIAVTVPEFAPVPFTHGYLHFKGYLGHGWLGKDRYIINPILHEKKLYLKAGGDLPINLYGGFVHYAVWGGEHATRGPLPSGIKDFIPVFFGKDAPESSGLGGDNFFNGEVGNALGNHLGMYDFGLEANLFKYRFRIYHQTPWEDLTSLKLFRNTDRLMGVSVQDHQKKVISKLLYEFLYTKYQSGPGTPDPVPGQSNYGYPYGGRDNYYNNYLYRSGWTYRNMIIGSPLFISTSRGKNYFQELDDDRYAIISNRLVTHHFGIGGWLRNNINYKAMATYSRNFGTYGGINLGRYNWASMDPDIEVNYNFDPPLEQVYILFEANTILPFNKNITLQTAIGSDIGAISRNFGGLIGLRWNGVVNNAFNREISGINNKLSK